MDTHPENTAERYDHRNTYVLRLIAAAAALSVFFLIHYLYTADLLLDFDRTVGNAIRSLRGPLMDPLMKSITFMGNWEVLVGTGVVILAVNLISWHKADCNMAVIAALINSGLYQALKHIIKRPRPDDLLWLIEEHGYSLPSGHSMNSMFCYGIMLYLVWRNIENVQLRNALTVLLCLLPPLLAFSRVYCGVHYPSDVIAGLSAGFAMLMIMTVIIDEIILRRTI